MDTFKTFQTYIADRSQNGYNDVEMPVSMQAPEQVHSYDYPFVPFQFHSSSSTRPPHYTEQQSLTSFKALLDDSHGTSDVSQKPVYAASQSSTPSIVSTTSFESEETRTTMDHNSNPLQSIRPHNDSDHSLDALQTQLSNTPPCHFYDNFHSYNPTPLGLPSSNFIDPQTCDPQSSFESQRQQLCYFQLLQQQWQQQQQQLLHHQQINQYQQLMCKRVDDNNGDDTSLNYCKDDQVIFDYNHNDDYVPQVNKTECFSDSFASNASVAPASEATPDNKASWSEKRKARLMKKQSRSMFYLKSFFFF